MGQDVASRIEELRRLIREQGERYDAFALPRFNTICDQVLRGGLWYPDHQIRLFRRGTVQWEDVHHRPPIAALGDYWRRMVRYGRGTSEYFLLHRDSERIARLFPASPVARLLMLPLLAAAVLARIPKHLPTLPGRRRGLDRGRQLRHAAAWRRR